MLPLTEQLFKFTSNTVAKKKVFNFYKEKKSDGKSVQNENGKLSYKKQVQGGNKKKVVTSTTERGRKSLLLNKRSLYILCFFRRGKKISLFNLICYYLHYE